MGSWGGIIVLSGELRRLLSKPVHELSMRDAAGRALVEIGSLDENVVVVTADVARSTRAYYFARAYPDRFVNVGIAEQDMIGFAAGLALAGKKPYVFSFSIFLMRAWEQIRNSIDRMNLDVKLIGTHSGFSDHADGSSHHSLEDIALMRVLHNMSVIIPADPNQVYEALHYIHMHVRGPVYVRIGRDYSPRITEPNTFRYGEVQVLVDGSDVAIISAGPVLAHALMASRILSGKGVSAAVVNLHTVKPIDVDGLEKIARKTGLIVVVEEHYPRGGLYSAVAEALVSRYPVPMTSIAVRGYGRSARSVHDLYRLHGLTPEVIAFKVIEVLKVFKR